MSALLANLIPWSVLVFDLVSLLVLAALLAHKGWGRAITRFVGEHALVLGLLISLGAVGGSLFYSEVIGFTPCVLCWWQRIAIYPMLVLFLTALKFKDRGVFKYVWRLAVLGSIVALYHAYIQWGGNPLIPCDVGASCAKLYVYRFHYVTIPTMSLSVLASFLLLSWADKLYQRS